MSGRIRRLNDFIDYRMDRAVEFLFGEWAGLTIGAILVVVVAILVLAALFP